jgi:calcineurin-like phosphoesterase family protein
MPEFDFDQFAFVTSDTHFGHARIIALTGRPFATVHEMDEEMVARWNAIIDPTDAVLHLGDLALGRIADSLPITGRLNGRKFLIPGNHDRVSTATQTHAAIERFTPLYEEQGWTILPEIVDGVRHGHPLRASHYPYRGDTLDTDRLVKRRPVDDGTPLIHGHTHARDHGADGIQFHVGVDAYNFTPVPSATIDEWLDALAAGVPSPTM